MPTAALLPGWYNRLALAAIAIAVALVLSRLARWWVERLARRGINETRDLTRLRRRETAAFVLATAVRYALAVAALFAVLGIFVRNTAAAIGGATFVISVVAFGFQRLAEDLLPTTLKSALADDGLLTDPIVYTLDEGAVQRYERRVIVS